MSLHILAMSSQMSSRKIKRINKKNKSQQNNSLINTINFKSNYKYPEISKNHINLSTHSIPENIKLKSFWSLNDQSYRGSVVNSSTEIKKTMFANKYKGRYCNTSYEISSFSSPMPGSVMKGKIDGQDLNLICLGKSPRYKLIGEYNGEKIELEFYNTNEFSHLKGEIAGAKAEILVKESTNSKDVTGILDGVKFNYHQSCSYMDGGIAAKLKLFPLIHVIANSTGHIPEDTSISDDNVAPNGEDYQDDAGDAFRGIYW